MTSAATPKGFKVTVKGEYYALAADMRRKTPMPYEIEVVLPSMDSALSIIKNKLLAKALRRKYKDYQDFRTHMITNVVDLSGQSASGLIPDYMNKKQLSDYVRVHKLPVNTEAYDKLVDFRKAIHLAETNPKEFQIFQDNAMKDAKMNRELANLNPDLQEESPAPPAPSAAETTQKPAGPRPGESSVAASPDNKGQGSSGVAADEL